MTKEEKDLLLKDLCGRVPYGVIIQYHDKYDWSPIKLREICKYTLNGTYSIEKCKPYLRPFTSITEDEIKEWMVMKYGGDDICVRNLISCKSRKYNISCTVEISWYSDMDDECAQYEDYKPKSSTIFTISSDNVSINFIDWLNEHHFDYRGLIGKGLALEAKNDMYNF